MIQEFVEGGGGWGGWEVRIVNDGENCGRGGGGGNKFGTTERDPYACLCRL